MTRLLGVPVVGRTERELRRLTDGALSAAIAAYAAEQRKFLAAHDAHIAMWRRERNLSPAVKRKRRSVAKSYRRMARAWADAARRGREIRREREDARREERAKLKRTQLTETSLEYEARRWHRAERLLASVPNAVQAGYARVLTLLREERRRREPDLYLEICLRLLAEDLRPRVKGARTR